MRKFLLLLLFFVPFAQAATVSADYEAYNHKIQVHSVRAGNHDESGKNDYYFVVSLYALKNTKEELAKEQKDRAKSKVNLGEFGSISLEVLKIWKPDAKKKEAPLSFDVAGDSLRKIVSSAMREFQVLESEIAVMVEIEMFEREKSFFGFMGEDKKITQVQYFPVPPSEYNAGGRHDQELELVDDKGTNVKVKVVYQTPEITTAEKAADAQKPPLK